MATELLRELCFVAPVPRPEDVGIDVIATLFRRDEDMLMAERSFLVQCKGNSVRKVRYRDHDADWLRRLELPLFFMKVDRPQSRAKLYTSARASRHPNYRDRTGIVLKFNNSQPIVLDEELHVGFGPPILSWTIEEVQESDFAIQAYQVLRKWIEIEAEASLTRAWGIMKPVQWETNELPEVFDGFVGMQTPDDMSEILRNLERSYQCVMSRATSIWDDEDDDLRMSLLLMREFMRRNGLDPDPPGVIAAIVRERQRRIERLAAQQVAAESAE